MVSGTYNEIKNKHYLTTRIDGLYNITNAIAGYNPDRLFTVSAFAGPVLPGLKHSENKMISML
jgi:hypothetical protein